MTPTETCHKHMTSDQTLRAELIVIYESLKNLKFIEATSVTESHHF